MHAFLRFNSGVMRMSTPARLYLLLLVTANMVIPLFFLGRLEAQVVLATFVPSFVLMLALTATSGFTRLLGLGHMFWVPAVVVPLDTAGRDTHRHVLRSLDESSDHTQRVVVSDRYC